MIVGLALLAVWVWAMVDAVRAPGFRLGNRWVWVLVIALLPPIGTLAYLVLGREWKAAEVTRLPHPSRHDEPTRTTPRGPDDDPEFLASL